MHELVEQALALSRADQCIVLAWETTTANVRWANNTSTTNGVGRSTRLAVVSVIGRRVGSVSVTSVSAGDLEAVVRRSEDTARTTPEAEDAQPPLEGNGSPPDWDAPAGPAGIERFAELAPALGRAFVQAGEDGIRLFGYAELSSSTCWLASSTGVAAMRRTPMLTLAIVSIMEWPP